MTDMLHSDGVHGGTGVKMTGHVDWSGPQIEVWS